MARPTQDAIQAFMSITGASETLALQRLEEHGGNVSQAVNAHYGQLESNILNPASGASAQGYPVHDSDHGQARQSGLPSLFSAARAFRPSLLLGPNYRRNLYNQIGSSTFARGSSPVLHTGQAGFPIDTARRDGQMRPSEPALDTSRNSSGREPEILGSIDRDQGFHLSTNDIEDEMIQAAIEASKKDALESPIYQGYDSARYPSDASLQEEILQKEEEELARALSLSLKSQELEKAMNDLTAKEEHQQQGAYNLFRRSESDRNRSKPGSSMQSRTEDIKQKQPINHVSGYEGHLHHSEESPNKEEWGGLSSKELDEAIMLEKAIFNEVPNNTSHILQHDANLGRQSIINEEELERQSPSKESSLPAEPAADNENAITLLIRLPEGSRHGRRFLMSDRLQNLFDFIDFGGAVKPGSYRVVRPYPRRAFSVDESAFSLKELGLTSKQETLYLELI